MTMADMHRAHADDGRKAAASAVLANVRDAHLRSAAVWDKMADQAERVARVSAANAAAKAAQAHR